MLVSFIEKRRKGGNKVIKALVVASFLVLDVLLSSFWQPRTHRSGQNTPWELNARRSACSSGVGGEVPRDGLICIL